MFSVQEKVWPGRQAGERAEAAPVGHGAAGAPRRGRARGGGAVPHGGRGREEGRLHDGAQGRYSVLS